MTITGFKKINPVYARSLSRAFLSLYACVLTPLTSNALISSSGEYRLESSVRDNGGGELISGGGYASRGSAGQNTIPGGQGNSAAGEYVNRAGFYNPPHFTFQKGLASVITFNSGSASLTLPPGAVEKEVFDITLNRNPISEPDYIDPSIINSANSKIERNEGGWARLFPDNITEMSLFDEQDAWARPFAKAASHNAVQGRYVAGFLTAPIHP